MHLSKILWAGFITSWLSASIPALAVDGKSFTNDLGNSQERWVSIPITVRPTEKVAVRDYKGMMSNTYINHAVTNKTLRVRAGQANVLYFGPWRFQVDAGSIGRMRDLEVSVRLSHLNANLPNTYTDLGQRLFSGKVYRDSQLMLFVADARARFEGEGSPLIVEVEFGSVDEERNRSLSAAEFVSDQPARSTTVR